MSDRDAFGRSSGEDPLADMGWDRRIAEPAGAKHIQDEASVPYSEASATPDSIMVGGSPLAGAGTAPDAMATPAQWAHGTSDAPGRRVTRRPSSPGGIAAPVGKLVAFAVVLGVGAAIAVPIVGSVSDTIDSFTVPTFTTDDDRPATGGSDRPAKPPVGVGRGSLVLRGNLAPAIRDLRREVGGRLRLVRIAPGSVQVQAVRGSKLINASKQYNGDVTSSSSPAGASGLTTFAWSRLDLSAPRRIVTRMGAPSRFDYAVLLDVAGLRWSAFQRGGRNLQFTPAGRLRAP